MVLNSKNAAERAARGLPEPPTCAGHKKDGTPCKKHPIRGSTVCRVHGGAAPQVRKRAQERLQAAADILMAQLLKIAASAESEAVRLAAVKDALDRAGFGAAQLVKIAAAQPFDDFLADLVNDDLFEDVPPVKRRALPPGSGVGDDEDEDYNQAQRAEDEEEERIELSFDTPGTIRGKVIRNDPEPTPAQRAAAARTAQRARTALFGSDATDADDEFSEYGSSESPPATDPSRPPQYVREAMEDAGEDWRAGEGAGSRRADMGS